jgi:hypothetical protein
MEIAPQITVAPTIHHGIPVIAGTSPDEARRMTLARSAIC